MMPEEKIQICGTRYGNVACSRGSVIPLFVEQMKAGEPLTVTDPEMTRFIMTLEEAVELVIFAFVQGQSGDILVQKAPACTLRTLAQALCEVFSYKEGMKIIGTRHGEKMYETLLTKEESVFSKDMGDYYRILPDNRDLNYDVYFTKGDKNKRRAKEFNSKNARQLGIEEMKEKLLSLSYIQKELEHF
jgi:UDP-glucose 4-epimerase